MADSYTSNLRFIDQVTGSNAGTWGDKADTNFSLIEAALSGYTSIAVTGGTKVLSANDGGADEARLAIIKFTGTLASNQIVQIPSVSKEYIIFNSTSVTASETFSIKTLGGSALEIPTSGKVHIFCDGLDCHVVAPSTLNCSLAAAGNVISNAEMRDWSESVNVLGSVSGTLGAGAIDYTLGHRVTMTLTGNLTIANNSIANFPASGKGGSLMLIITQGGSGGYTLTLGANFKKAGGSIVLSTSIAARDRVLLLTENGGATVDCSIATNYT
jgi:hypothetical protein